ncbi:MAG: glycosyltransferase family 1 protein [Chitinophagaceae bacterium]|nr:glycosyltransferase family 1 protein [Chitinophagaceae bacterium]
MKIAILTLGTRGDVQPYAVLGQALQERGHDVVLSTAKNFEKLVSSYGLRFVPVEIDFQELIESEEAKKIMKNPFRMKRYLRDTIFPKMSDAFQTFYQLAEENDKVLFHVKTLCDYFADRFPGNMIKADVVPASEPTNAFPNPVFSALGFPSFMNKFTYRLTELGLKMWKKPILAIRERVGLSSEFVKPSLPSLYGISEYVLPKPNDYPSNCYFTGFWVHERQEALDEDLLQFLQSGEPPLLVTFGSMPFENKAGLANLIKAIVIQQKVRVLVIRGWGLTNTTELEKMDGVKVIHAAPYSVLLPYVKAVIHHGGVGTTAACLRAGKPMLICPILYPFGDQLFWGNIIYQNGWGVKPVPLKKISEVIFNERVKALLHTASLYASTSSISQRLQKEDGVAKAIDLIENNFSQSKT